jgi:hypothetical protein
LLPFDAAKMRRHEIERFYLQAISKELVELDQDGALRDSVKTFELLVGSDDDLDNWWLWAQSRPRPNAVLAIDVNETRNMRGLLERLFTVAGIYEKDRGFKCDVTVTRDVLTEFVTVCREQRERIERLLDTSLRKDLDTKATRQLGAFLGRVGLSLQKYATKKEGDAKIYLYRVNAGQLATVQAVAQRRKSMTAKAEWEELQRARFPEDAPETGASVEDESASDGDELDAIQAALDAKAELYARAPELAPTEPDF